ncbi:hypothetical protein CCP3SC1AL1_260011 [Gammaproteobacteria bacterium]
MAAIASRLPRLWVYFGRCRRGVFGTESQSRTGDPRGTIFHLGSIASWLRAGQGATLTNEVCMSLPPHKNLVLLN